MGRQAIHRPDQGVIRSHFGLKHWLNERWTRTPYVELDMILESISKYFLVKCQEVCPIECQIICGIECRKICQIECKKIYQIECRTAEEKSAR